MQSQPQFDLPLGYLSESLGSKRTDTTLLIDEKLAACVLDLGRVAERITHRLQPSMLPFMLGRDSRTIADATLVHAPNLLLPCAVQALLERQDQTISI